MSVLHRAVSELAELTTFREVSASAVCRCGRGQWLLKAASSSYVPAAVGAHALVADLKRNRLHQAICALAEVATFSRR